MLDMYVHNLLSMKSFHGALAGKVHECSLTLSIGRVRSIHIHRHVKGRMACKRLRFFGVHAAFDHRKVAFLALAAWWYRLSFSAPGTTRRPRASLYDIPRLG